MTPEDIIGYARELDPSFDADRHPPKVAINHLTRLQRRLVGEWTKHEPMIYVETFEVTFPLTDFEAGVELVTGESVEMEIDMTAIHEPLDYYLESDTDEERAFDLPLIPWRDRNRSRFKRCAWIRGHTLFFPGEEEDWEDVAKVVLTYTPTPPAITALDEDLVLPDTAEDVLALQLGAFFARRSSDEELARPRREYIVDANDAEALWVDELRRRRGASSSRTRMVW